MSCFHTRMYMQILFFDQGKKPHNFIDFHHFSGPHIFVCQKKIKTHLFFTIFSENEIRSLDVHLQ